MNHRSFRSFRLLLLVLSLSALACDASDLSALFGGGGKPAIVITSPPSGSQFHEGEEVAIQSVSTDANGILRVELVVDGQIVRTDTLPVPQNQFALIQTWKATQGTHTILVRAYNTQSVSSDPAAVSIQVSPGTIAGGPGTPIPVPPTSTTAPGGPSPTTGPAGCTNNSAFVADVTIPDGATMTAGQSFTKIWRLSNSGTCTWGAGYQFVFVSGDAMTPSTVIAAPNTAPGATADISVGMTAPATPGTYTGQWRMRTSGGANFGQTVSVKISVPGAPAAPTNTSAPGCPGPPVIASFTASPNPITAGSSTTLNWGAVSNATSASIDNGIGGVASPGSTSVSPPSTTTYTLTATGCGGVTTSQVTVTVNPAPPAGQPDLTVTAVDFDPAAPTPGGSFQVRITINNLGPVAVSDFVVRALRQSPGANCLTDPGTVLFDRHTSVGAGGSTVFTENASIASSGNYRICARLDHTNSVAESNEGNNYFQRDLTVAAAGQPDLRPHFIGLSDNTPTASQTIGANITLRNDGTAAVSSFNVRLLRQTTSASCPGPGTVMFDRTAGPLAASGSMVFNETFQFGASGTFRLCVVLDHMNNVAESNEGNNALQSGNITVSP